MKKRGRYHDHMMVPSPGLLELLVGAGVLLIIIVALYKLMEVLWSLPPLP